MCQVNTNEYPVNSSSKSETTGLLSDLSSPTSSMFVEHFWRFDHSRHFKQVLQTLMAAAPHKVLPTCHKQQTFTYTSTQILVHNIKNVLLFSIFHKDPWKCRLPWQEVEPVTCHWATPIPPEPCLPTWRVKLEFTINKSKNNLQKQNKFQDNTSKSQVKTK